MAPPLPSVADPERALVTSYAPAAARSALTILWALDERLAQVVASTREPGLGLIRLAWWREALERLDRAPPPAEPLLGQVAERLLPRGVTGETLGRLADGWTALLADPLDRDARDAFASARGATLFVAAAALLGSVENAEIGAAGAGWSLVDLAHRSREEGAGQAALAAADRGLRGIRIAYWPKALRPLAALTALARSDARAGRTSVRPGSPGRVARLAVAGLFGR